MHNPHPLYMCFPSVVCTDRPTKVKIAPRDISRAFRQDKEYELCVVGVCEDSMDYHNRIPLDFPCTVENGCLCFEHTFKREQEYSVRFAEKGAKETRITMYAVNEDLYNLRPLKGELHTHTYYSDGTDGVPMILADYREDGFDFVSVTDHNRMYTNDLAREVFEGIPLGLCVINGEEVHTPGSIVHIVHAGGEKSVCARYIHDTENYEKEVAEIEKTLSHIPEQYRHRAALAKWACDEIHKAGGIAIFPHPYWKPNLYNVGEDFCNILFDLKCFDAFELAGGVCWNELNQQLALWQEQYYKGNKLRVVGSSDSHNHDFSKDITFGRRFTLVWAKDNTKDAILEAINNGYSLAAELPNNCDNEVRFYGESRRLVLFAQFLWKNYFNQTWRLCFGEGILMRRYAEGEDVGEILAKLENTVKDFYERFYGITGYQGLTEKQLDYLAKCRKVQNELGPITKGSALHIYGANERRE